MRSPIFNGLYKFSKIQRIPFNAPGHKGKVTMRARNLSMLDLNGSSKDGDALNLRELTAVSEDEISKKYKTCRTMYLRNGATGGIYAMMGAYLRPGDRVIVDRECHRSVINALIIQGLEPIYVKRSFNYQYSICGGVDPEAIERAIVSYRDAKAVIITSPTYYGVISDVKSIAGICHRYGVKLLVDEALGAHFGFSEKLPKSSIKLGADLAVHSVHKTLGSFGGGALLHINDPEIDFQRITDVARMYESSSASPALLCTLENAVYYAFENTDLFDRMLAQIEKCKKVICENTAIRWLGNELSGTDSIYEMDPSRIVLNFSHARMNGYEAANFLRNKANIEVESASESNVVCLVSIYNSSGEIKKLFHALASLSKNISEKTAVINDVIDNRIPEDLDLRLSPTSAFHSSSEFVSADMAIDRINKRIVYRMPDEIPLILPGERIRDCHLLEISKILSADGVVKGLGPQNTVEVVGITESFGI